jgi:GNAT superfamily N-acetyltransferase
VLRPATEADTPALVELINRAFEPERTIIEGDRLDAGEITRLAALGDFLVVDGEAGVLVAAIYVAVRGDRGYLGLLSVEPSRQGRGLGRALVAAAEDRCRERGCGWMDLRVVDQRSELPPFYRRLGYLERTTEPFTPSEAHRLKVPCHFIVMSRAL